MNLRVAIVVAFVLSPSGVVSGAGTEPAKKPSVPAAVRSFLDNKCIGCHQGPKAPAGFDLKTLAFDLTDTHTLNRGVRIHDAVQRGQMPPGGKSTVKSTEREGFVRLLGRPIAEFETLRAATEGRAVLRRLNRYEYENTIRDVLSAPWLQLRDSLPEDGLVSRFNKSGQALDISHVQMARYMETAEDALRQVLRASQEPSVSKRYYARDQKRFINRMKYSPFNRHPERATIPILGFTAQPGVIAETEPISVGDKDPATRDVEGYATPAGNYVGNEHHFDGFVAPTGGKYRLGLNAFSLWIHTIHEKGGKGVMYWRPNRSKTERGRTLEPVTLYALSRGGEKRLLTSFDVGPEPSLHEIEVYLLPGEQILPDAARLFRSRPGFTGSPEATEAGMPGVAYRWMDVTGPLASSEKQDSYRVLFGDLPASRAKDGAV
ncbi:MAG TPA: DUF1587 domain-containing protein, partial [Bryobacteraceae bacterium]|nr:DUF1587 domain-containing protein [Bryobacteraceae bacterium]